MSSFDTAADAVTHLPHIDEFIASIPQKRTGTTYKYVLGTWSVFLHGTRTSKPSQLDTWTDDLIERFHTWMVRKSYRMSTIACSIAALKRYLRWLDSQELIPTTFHLDKAFNRWYIARGGGRYSAQSRVRTPDSRIPLIVSYYDNQELPPDDEEHKFYRITLLRARAIVHVLYSSAGRVSEIASLTRAMVRDGLASECVITGKGNKDRVIFFTAEARQAIVAYCHERDDDFPYLFISYGRGYGKPLGRSTIWSIVVSAAKAVGIGSEGAISPHAFRHYRAQQLLDNGMDIDTLQAYLGHTSIDLTRRVYAPNTPPSKIRMQLDKFGIDPHTASSPEQRIEHINGNGSDN